MLRREMGLTRYATLALVAALAGVGGSYLYIQTTARSSSPTMKIERLRSPYATEEDWLVADIVGDLSDMVLLAATRWDGVPHARVTAKSSATAATVVTISISRGPVVNETLRLEHSTWSPEDFATLASHLIAALGVRPPENASAAEDESLLQDLLDSRSDVIAEKSAAVSEALRVHPADPRLHEEAALVLGALALKEAAGSFSDSRHLLCRMTAHLALARGLRGSSPATSSGRFAEAVLAAVAERGAEAEKDLERLGAGTGSSEAERGWRRLLLMRVTEDWRGLPDPATGALAERLEWLRAVDRALGSARALQMMEEARVEPGREADWALILTRSPSVEVGNMLLEPALEMTLNEAAHMWSSMHGNAPPPADRAAVLNDPAQPFLSTDGPRVLAWGTWAAMYQRRLMHILYQTERHYRHMLSVKDAARQFVAEQKPRFSRLTLFPIVAACWEAEEEKPAPAPLDAAITWLLEHPELTTTSFWWGVEDKTVRQRSPRRIPPRVTWFTTGCVRGTTFDAVTRGEGLHLSPEQLGRLKVVSPKSYDVARLYVSAHYKGSRPVADVSPEFGDRVAYDTRALYDLSEWAYEQDPQAVIRFDRRMCELNVGWCNRLGGDCADLKDEACAMTAFERVVRGAADRLRAAESSRWLLRYYLRAGRLADAKALAKTAAEVGSSMGLLTMASFLEATHQYASAEECLRGEAERYTRKEPEYHLIGFYHRMARVRGVKSYEAKFAKATKDIFPVGLEKAELASFTAPPSDGAVFTGESGSLRRNGLHRNDVVVALDGWRVRTFEQYAAVRTFDDDPDFRLIVWRDPQYLEVSARRLSRMFGADMQSFRRSQR